MSFLKKLFGGGGGGDESSKPAPKIEHEGYIIRSTPIKEGGQLRLCGVITKEIDGEIREHTIVRADLLTTEEDAADMLFMKAKQVIRERGDAMFDL